MDEAGGQEIIVESWSPTCAVLAEFQTEFQTEIQTEIHADDTAAIVLRRAGDCADGRGAPDCHGHAMVWL